MIVERKTKEKQIKMRKDESLEAVHTHTHTHTIHLQNRSGKF